MSKHLVPLVPGFKNSQRIRFVVDGVGMYCTIKDAITNFATVSHGEAVADALKKLAHIRSGTGVADQCATGLVCTAFNGKQVQIDLV